MSRRICRAAIAGGVTGLLALLVVGTRLGCLLGLHLPGWAYVGTSWSPDDWTRSCSRCGAGL